MPRHDVRKSMWLTLWETLHGSVQVTSEAQWADTDAQLDHMERTLRHLQAEADLPHLGHPPKGVSGVD